MAQTGSISLLLRNLKAGDDRSLVALHNRCWPWITQSARKRLGNVNLQSADEEDVAQEAFWGFVQSVRNQRVPQLATRHDLFALLTHIVACKAATQLESQMAAKRGFGRVFDESAFGVGSDMSFNRNGNALIARASSKIGREGDAAQAEPILQPFEQ